MNAALQQACLGRGLCAPNPSVGAVLTANQQIIAQAWHKGAGTAHAEQLVLENNIDPALDLTLYVTLEPCNHWGRTPPCVQAIIQAGIKRVVYGFSDPNPIVAANNTPKILRQAGIEVIYFPLPEIAQFYQSYQFWTQKKMPWVKVKLAHTLDGKIALPHGKPIQLSNQLCSKFTHQQRQYCDIILTTARTINQDNPQLTARVGDRCISKPIAIIDTYCKVLKESQVFKHAQWCHIYYSLGCPIAGEKESYYQMPKREDKLDLYAILSHLAGLGYHEVWVEAGGQLFASLHAANLVQQTYLYIVPKILGENAVPAYPNVFASKRPYSLSWHPLEDNVMGCFEWEE